MFIIAMLFLMYVNDYYVHKNCYYITIAILLVLLMVNVTDVDGN